MIKPSFIMLTLLQLQAFSLKRQDTYIWEYGTLTNRRLKDHTIISLYQMDNYFAQIDFNDSENKIEAIIFQESMEKNRDWLL
jgi:hypothetical protein